MLIEISKSVCVNPEAIESLECTKDTLRCTIIMKSGTEWTAEFPYEIMKKRINDRAESFGRILRNIDNNTQSVRS